MRWINCKDKMPNSFVKKIKFRDASTHAEVSTLALNSAINTNQLEFIEWQDESETAESPLEQQYREALEKIIKTNHDGSHGAPDPGAVIATLKFIAQQALKQNP